ncbi:hypothetical protein [Desulforamulus hydrothermalis]|uniref:Uncharacterized protein n=1 Tax=Desulforamulus hydrothermalis Lam5 = DSM 18033 TaxID=1121428 RepID=K8DXS1_9FIRM|nr:hypothetical protein [Desulforamulus hydrothermalis]CCO07527.1 conserved hypothetical protein [Desulforamulus hydrothermalis Lam5 = DSM 18033]SHH30663.1 hypothetical protein SAMN02745177_02141 [Desulforamulus hydrothermalis Lam5 = DSM 18033]
MSSINLKFAAEKVNDFDRPGEFEQFCNLCGCTEAEVLPEVEYLNKKEIKSICLSVYCSSKECRNLSYHYFEPDDKLRADALAGDFTPLPKGLKFTCNRCGNQNIQVKVKLEQSGFKFVHDIVAVSLSCSCGNQATHRFLGKYF